jgi:type VI secretion system protein ImpA
MSIVDVDVLLQELTADAPCGPNLEYDPAFLEFEKIIQGKPEVQYGSTIVPAEPPDWKQVKKQGFELLERTRDLRVAMPLVRALLLLHAMPGFADGLHLLGRLSAERWDSIHPQLDPDDGNDPTERINALSALTDGATFLRDLKETTFIQLPGLGALTLRLLDQVSGELPAPKGQSVPSQASIDAALHDVSADALASARAAATTALDSVASLEATLTRHVGSMQSLNLDPLKRQLRRIHDLLASGPAAAPAESEAEPPGAEGAAAAAGQAAAPAPISGEIHSRADVLRMLDKILDYYEKYEPSSPVPMLLARARRLAPKSFLEVMEDLAPDSVTQLRVIRGPLPEGQTR